MAPRKQQHHSKKKQINNNTKKNKPCNSPLTSSSLLEEEHTSEVFLGKDPSNTVHTSLLDDSTTGSTKQPLAVAFCLGSEHATVTLLPKQPGEYGQVIANEDGERHIPCIVSYVGDELIAGTAAKAQMIRNLSGTARFFVPMIGLKYEDEKVQSILPFLSVPVESDEEGYPKFILSNTFESSSSTAQENEQDNANRNVITGKNDVTGTKKSCSITDLVVVVLKTLKQSAESYTGQVVDQCFLSYPMEFTPHQIQMLKQCAELTGLTVVSMISEPMAAVLAFQQHHLLNPSSTHHASSMSSSSISSSIEAYHASSTTHTDGLWLFVDVGALFTRFVLVNVSVGLYTIVKHTTVLNGGLHLDQLLSDYFRLDFEKKQSCQVKDHQVKALQKLRCASELTRKVLSTQSTANCHVEAVYEGLDYIGTMNRMRFESVTRPWRTQFETHLNAFLDTLALDPYEVQRVIVLGGVLKTPRFTSLLSSILGNAQIDTSIESDFAVAFGTSLHSLQSDQFDFSSSSDPTTPRSSLTTPHLKYPFGIVDQQGQFIPLISKASPLPLSYHVVITPPNQPKMAFIQFAEGRDAYIPTPASDHDDDDDDDKEEDDLAYSKDKKTKNPSQNGSSSFSNLSPPMNSTLLKTSMDSISKSESSMNPDSTSTNPYAPPLYDLEPAYQGTVVSECLFQLEAGIDKIYLAIHLNESNEATISAAAYNDTTQAKQQLTLTI